MRARTVVEVGSSVASAQCARLLCHLGANVVKVEPPGGDPLRARGPIVTPNGGGEPVNALFEVANGGKRSLTLDLEREPGREALARLIARADAVVLGPDLAPVAAHAPSIVRPGTPVACFTHFGLAGPYAELLGSDFTDWAAGGYTFMTGYESGRPHGGGGPWVGYAAGAVGAFMTMTAWFRQARTPASELYVFDVSIQDVLVYLHQWTFSLYANQGVIKRRGGNRHAESYHPMGFLPCRDGWVCVGVASLEQWEKFCIAVDMPELIADPRFDTGAGRLDNAEALDAILWSWFGERGMAEVVEHLQAHDVPASPVQSIAETLADPQLAHRSFWVARDFGGQPGVMPGFGFPNATAAGRVALPAPRAGEHSREVLAALGYAAAEIDALLREPAGSPAVPWRMTVGKPMSTGSPKSQPAGGQ